MEVVLRLEAPDDCCLRVWEVDGYREDVGEGGGDKDEQLEEVELTGDIEGEWMEWGWEDSVDGLLELEDRIR